MEYLVFGGKGEKLDKKCNLLQSIVVFRKYVIVTVLTDTVLAPAFKQNGINSIQISE